MGVDGLLTREIASKCDYHYDEKSATAGKSPLEIFYETQDIQCFPPTIWDDFYTFVSNSQNARDRPLHDHASYKQMVAFLRQTKAINSIHQQYELHLGALYLKSSPLRKLVATTATAVGIVDAIHGTNHFPVAETCARVNHLVYGIPDSVVAWLVDKCAVCASKRAFPSVAFGKLDASTMTITRRFDGKNTIRKPFDRIQLDIIDSTLNPSFRWKHILLVRDHFSNFSALYPLKEPSPLSICKHLCEFVRFYGSPSLIQHGGGTVLDCAIALLAIERELPLWRARPRTPETSRVAVVMVAIIKRMISKYTKLGRAWHRKLVSMAMRLNQHEKPGFKDCSASSVIFGKARIFSAEEQISRRRLNPTDGDARIKAEKCQYEDQGVKMPKCKGTDESISNYEQRKMENGQKETLATGNKQTEALAMEHESKEIVTPNSEQEAMSSKSNGLFDKAESSGQNETHVRAEIYNSAPKTDQESSDSSTSLGHAQIAASSITDQMYSSNLALHCSGNNSGSSPNDRGKFDQSYTSAGNTQGRPLELKTETNMMRDYSGKGMNIYMGKENRLPPAEFNIQTLAKSAGQVDASQADDSNRNQYQSKDY